MRDCRPGARSWLIGAPLLALFTFLRARLFCGFRSRDSVEPLASCAGKQSSAQYSHHLGARQSQQGRLTHGAPFAFLAPALHDNLALEFPQSSDCAWRDERRIPARASGHLAPSLFRRPLLPTGGHVSYRQPIPTGAVFLRLASTATATAQAEENLRGNVRRHLGFFSGCG